MEEQQNNNLSLEILNGNAESVAGLVGNAQALKEPGTSHSVSFTLPVSARSQALGEEPLATKVMCSFPDTVGAQSA